MEPNQELNRDAVENSTPDEPIEQLFENADEKEVVSPASEEPPIDEPPAEAPVESFTPDTNYGFAPKSDTPNDSPSAWTPQPQAVYIQAPVRAAKPKKEPKRINLGAGGFIAILLVVVLLGIAGGIGGSLVVNRLSPEQTSNNAVIGTPSEPTPIVIDDSGLENVVEAVYSKVSPSVVGIRVTASIRNWFFGESTQSGEGTGIVYSEDGYIITCYHVIEDAYSGTSGKIEVFLADNTDKGLDATVVGFNKSTDIALLKINKSGLTPADFGTSEGLKVGQYAIAIGNPGGIQFMSSVSYGVISGLNRTISVENLGEMKLIQTDAAINPGNSGGALVNTTGKVIGMSSSKLVSTEYEGMGFAVPVDTVLSIVKGIIENKDKPQPYLGVEYYTNVTTEWLAANGLPEGVVIKSVVPAGPAARANLQSGDIITMLNGQPVTDAETFSAVLGSCTPGTTVPIGVYRSGRNYTGSITVGSNNAQ